MIAGIARSDHRVVLLLSQLALLAGGLGAGAEACLSQTQPPSGQVALGAGAPAGGTSNAGATSAAAPNNDKRQEAAKLFMEGKRLEALPLLEELVKANPQDDEMLVALAASLVDHAATLPDSAAAAQERFRARDLLDRAWKLGNNSPLAMNLSQLLKQLPDSGAIKFSDNPKVEQAMRGGEVAFARRDFDQALRDYSQAFQLEPTNYSAALFIGNTYDKQNQFEKGSEWYQRAIGVDPNVETAYRYFADMVARQGDMRRARSLLIQALVAEPYNRMVWRELDAWATINRTQINHLYISVPPPDAPQNQDPAQKAPQKEQQKAASPSTGSGNFAAVWQAYRQVRDKWQQGDAFKKHFPEQTPYRHSLPEESEALTAAANILKKLAANKDMAAPLAGDPALSLLLGLQRAGAIDSYVLFSLGDSGIARDYAAYRAKSRDKLADYLDKFVVPTAN